MLWKTKLNRLIRITEKYLYVICITYLREQIANIWHFMFKYRLYKIYQFAFVYVILVSEQLIVRYLFVQDLGILIFS